MYARVQLTVVDIMQNVIWIKKKTPLTLFVKIPKSYIFVLQ